MAFLLDKHDTVGIDCVAMCVNDVICCGAKPLFFLDYIACGKNVPEKIAAIVSGVAEGCVQAGAALDRRRDRRDARLLPGGRIRPGGLLPWAWWTKQRSFDNTKHAGRATPIIALPSSGVHSNGFSLVRKVFDLE